jgi:hypothetical protein
MYLSAFLMRSISSKLLSICDPQYSKTKRTKHKEKKLTSVLNTMFRQNAMGPIRHAANDLDSARPLDPRRTLAWLALDIRRSVIAMPVLPIPAPNVTPMLVVRVAYSSLISVRN